MESTVRGDQTPLQTAGEEPESWRPNRWPDFFIIGAAKAGTTTLYNYLLKHPSLWMSRFKEPRFFNPNAEPELRDPANYHRLFEGANETQLRAESSTTYSMWPSVPDVPRSIHAINPNARFIYLLREPLSRCRSHFIHDHGRVRFRGQPYRMTFEEYLEFEPSIVQASDYATQVQRYLEYFPKESLLLLSFERFTKEPAWALRRVFEFLGVEDISESLASEPLHKNDKREFQARVSRERILAPFRRLPGLRLAYRCLPPSLRRKSVSIVENSFLGRRDRRQFEPPPILPETRERLRARFEPSTEYLVREFNFDAGWWAPDRREKSPAAREASG